MRNGADKIRSKGSTSYNGKGLQVTMGRDLGRREGRRGQEMGKDKTPRGDPVIGRWGCPRPLGKSVAWGRPTRPGGSDPELVHCESVTDGQPGAIRVVTRSHLSLAPIQTSRHTPSPPPSPQNPWEHMKQTFTEISQPIWSNHLSASQPGTDITEDAPEKQVQTQTHVVGHSWSQVPVYGIAISYRPNDRYFNLRSKHLQRTQILQKVIHWQGCYWVTSRRVWRVV